MPLGTGSNPAGGQRDSGWRRSGSSREGDALPSSSAASTSSPMGLPSRPPGDSRGGRGGRDSYRGGGRERFDTGRDGSARDYDRAQFGGRRGGYEGDNARSRDRDGGRGDSYNSTYRPQRDREGSRSPTRGMSRWGSGAAGRPRERSPVGYGSRDAGYRDPRRGSSPGLGRRSPSPSSSYHSRPAYPAGSDRGYPARDPRDSRDPYGSRRSRSPPSRTSEARREIPRRSPPSPASSRRGDRSPISRSGGISPVRGNERFVDGQRSISGSATALGSASGTTTLDGVPTGPRGGTFAPRGRGGPLRGGNVIPRGPSHAPRGASIAATSSSFSIRGRGGAMIRGRGRGGYLPGGFVDDTPAKSLARKVDAGGNVVTADLISLSPRADDHGMEEGEELEEGETEEGEMGGEAEYHSHPQAVDHEPQAAATISRQQERRQSLHLGTMPAQLAHSQAQQASDSQVNSPVVPVPASSYSNANPYSSSAWGSRPSQSMPGQAAVASPQASFEAGSSSQAAKTPVKKAPKTYTGSSFAKALQPEWEAEMWTVSSHRLAATSRLPLATNYHVPLSAANQLPSSSSNTPGGLTPGLASTPGGLSGGPSNGSSLSAQLRLTLMELKEATMEMEMSAFRVEELERKRSELM